jgi:hypothetical protein
MISRTYAVDRSDGAGLLCFKGFDQRAYSDNQCAKTMAVASHDGEIEIYFLDEGTAAREEFLRFAKQEAAIWHPHWVFLGFFVYHSHFSWHEESSNAS